MQTDEVSIEVRVTPVEANPSNVIAFCSLNIGDLIIIKDLALVYDGTPDNIDYTVIYPSKERRNKRYDYAYPKDRAARERILNAVVQKYMEVVLNGRGRDSRRG
jgi:DNA-binding cell septation regulator SpoVG